MKAVYLGSEPMEIPIKEDVFVIPNNEVPKFEKWLEEHDKQIKNKTFEKVSNTIEAIIYKKIEEYGADIIELYAEVIDDIQDWLLKEQNND